MNNDAPPPSGTSSGRLFETLRRDLVRGRFAAGQKLAINALRQRYQVGLSPLREALNALAAYGLLVQENQRGFRVPGLSEAELEDITRLRVELEGMAFEQAITQGDAQWEADLLGAAHRLKRADKTQDMGEAWETLHTRFHQTLVAPCGSAWLLRFIEQLHDQFDRYRRLGANPPVIRQPLDDQHQRLVELALERDASAGRALLNDHIRQSFDVALAHYRQHA